MQDIQSPAAAIIQVDGREILSFGGCSYLGLCDETPAPIFAFSVGDATDMRAVQAALYDEGIFVIYSNYVGAGPNGALRIAVFADHQPEHFDRLADALSRLLPMQRRPNQSQIMEA